MEVDVKESVEIRPCHYSGSNSEEDVYLNGQWLMTVDNPVCLSSELVKSGCSEWFLKLKKGKE